MPEWDNPKVLRSKFDGNIAEYVLYGEFRSACRNSLPLTDDVMRTLNQDIYNRYYTLLHRGVI